MSLTAAIHQPNYLPWCGYFAKLRRCQLFIFLDDVQMPSGRSYVSRTQVRAPLVSWLTVPTHHGHEELIRDVRFADDRWQRKHLATLQAHYARAPHFAEVMALLRPIYEACGDRLAAFNMRLIQAIAGYLGLQCRFARSSDLPVGPLWRDDRLIALCRQVGATIYLSGKGGQGYQEPDKFAAAGLGLEVLVHEPVPYPQGGQGDAPFVPGLSIIDALMHVGSDARGLL